MLNLPHLEKLSILYGSQTGNAEWISKHLAKECLSRGFSVKVATLDESLPLSPANNEFTIIITSTTGDGDPPDNSLKFWKFLRRLKGSEWQGFNYTVLGLGDTNYDNFNNNAKRIHRKLKDMGASCLYECGYADDAVGLELVVDNWISGIWPLLDSVVTFDTDKRLEFDASSINKSMSILNIDRKSVPKSKGNDLFNLDGALNNLTQLTNIAKSPVALLTMTEVPNTTEEPKGSALEFPEFDEFPMLKCVKIKAVRCLSSKSNTIELQLNADITFQPGDSLAIYAPNDHEEVELLLIRLKLNGSQMIVFNQESKTHFPRNISYFNLLKFFVDIRTIPRKSFFKMLSEYTATDDEKQLLVYLASKQGSNDYQRLRELGVTLLEILKRFPSCYPPFDRLIENLSRMQPRQFSLSSYPDPAICFKILHYKIEDKYDRLGLCTNWLDKITQKHRSNSWLDLGANAPTVPAYVKNAVNFNINKDGPLIMIANGTGITPFKSFLDYLVDTAFHDEVFLFYGCKDPEYFLYKDEVESMKSIKLRLFICYSQIEPKRHVQHAIKENSDIFLSTMNRNGKIYVCGSKEMAKGVHETLASILSPDIKSGTEILQQYHRANRYLREFW